MRAFFSRLKASQPLLTNETQKLSPFKNYIPSKWTAVWEERAPLLSRIARCKSEGWTYYFVSLATFMNSGSSLLLLPLHEHWLGLPHTFLLHRRLPLYRCVGVNEWINVKMKRGGKYLAQENSNLYHRLVLPFWLLLKNHTKIQTSAGYQYYVSLSLCVCARARTQIYFSCFIENNSLHCCVLLSCVIFSFFSLIIYLFLLTRCALCRRR